VLYTIVRSLYILFITKRFITCSIYQILLRWLYERVILKWILKETKRLWTQFLLVSTGPVTGFWERSNEFGVQEVHEILILGVCILLHVWDQGDSVFRLRNFNIVGFLLFILLRFGLRIISIDSTVVNRVNPMENMCCLKMVQGPKHVAQ
jgi:hypothetical protein